MDWRELIDEYCRVTNFDRTDTLERLLDHLAANNKVITENVSDFLFSDVEGFFS